MKLVTVSGPPSSGKTTVILKVIEQLRLHAQKIGIVKFDCLATYDAAAYEKAGVPVIVGLSGNLCPDHFFVSNIEDCVKWGGAQCLDILISESAGLCNRCSPHMKDVLSVCVVDCLSGIHTPQKIGPMLKLADIVVITKGDIISQAEREVFAYQTKQANPKAVILFINGLTGQGAFELSLALLDAIELDTLEGRRLRFPMPAALCSYCLGETKIGADYQMGNLRKIDISGVQR